MTLTSLVKGFEGKCKPHSLNTNMIHRRTDGRTTGFLSWLRKTGLDFTTKLVSNFMAISEAMERFALRKVFIIHLNLFKHG